MALPFEDDCFDAATMGYGLRNVADIPKALRVRNTSSAVPWGVNGAES